MQGRNKIQDAWSSTPYRVVELPNENGAVYAVERADGTGDSRRVHRKAMQICPSEPHICQPVRPSDKRTMQNGRETDEFQREIESDTEDIIIPVPKRGKTRTDSVPVPDTPTEVPEDLEAGSDGPAEPEIADEAEPEIADEAEQPLRRSSRTTAGKHGNLHKEPRSTVQINSLVAFHLVNLILIALRTHKQY